MTEISPAGFHLSATWLHRLGTLVTATPNTPKEVQ